MDTQKRLHENISALADGELAASEHELAHAARDTPEGQAAWQAYHQIGDALRSEHFEVELSTTFSTRLADLLAGEPALQLPQPQRSTEPLADSGNATPVTSSLG